MREASAHEWFSRYLVALSALVLIHSVALAVDARVLPAGRSRCSLIYGQSKSVSQTFNDRGEPESVTAAYNVDLSSKNLRTFSPELNDLVNFLNETGYRYNASKRDNGYYGITRDENDPKLGDALTAGFLAVDARAERMQYNLSYQYGVTDKLSLGFMVPYAKTLVNVGSSFRGLNTAEDIFKALYSSDPKALDRVVDGLNQLRSINSETFQTYLQGRGYQRFENYSGSALGDVIAGGRYNYLNLSSRSGSWINSVQGGMTIPTGKLKAANALTEVDVGQGAWDLGVGHISNYSPVKFLTLSHSLNYTYRLKSSRTLRVRQNVFDLMPDSSSEEEVSIWLGDKVWTDLGAKVSFTDNFSIEAGYEWFWKAYDRYQGSRSRDYGYLSEKTDSYLETLSITASANSISSFLKNEFLLPAEFSLAVFIPTRGRNSLIAPYGTAELALFF